MFRTNSPFVNTILFILFLVFAFWLIRVAMKILGTLLGIAMPILALGFIAYLIYTQYQRRY